MSIFIMCKGLPASGKSTWAEEQVLFLAPGDGVRINMDLIRKMLHVSRFDKEKTEALTQAARDQLLRMAFERLIPIVISDDTNLSPDTERHLRELAEEYGAEFVIQDFTDVSPEVCAARDARREVGRVGREVIFGMHRQFLSSES